MRNNAPTKTIIRWLTNMNQKSLTMGLSWSMVYLLMVPTLFETRANIRCCQGVAGVNELSEFAMLSTPFKCAESIFRTVEALFLLNDFVFLAEVSTEKSVFIA